LHLFYQELSEQAQVASKTIQFATGATVFTSACQYSLFFLRSFPFYMLLVFNFDVNFSIFLNLFVLLTNSLKLSPASVCFL